MPALNGPKERITSPLFLYLISTFTRSAPSVLASAGEAAEDAVGGHEQALAGADLALDKNQGARLPHDFGAALDPIAQMRGAEEIRGHVNGDRRAGPDATRAAAQSRVGETHHHAAMDDAGVVEVAFQHAEAAAMFGITRQIV